MKIILVILCLIVLSAVSQAEEASDYRMMYYTFLAVDYLQTRNFLAHDRKEANPLLGESPSLARVNGAFILAASTFYLGDRFIPEPYKMDWIKVWVLFEGFAVGNNVTAEILWRF